MSSKEFALKKISNPPFKSFINYRIGDYNTFRRAMRHLIQKNGLLSAAAASMLKSDRSDYGMALVDMWAYLGDILTYYQERIASESFLRTARLEESVIELLYLVDYMPQRGRSASTLVRFVANEKNVQPTESIIIPKGFKVRSIPPKGQEAVIFETNEPIAISPDHNVMKLDGWKTSYKIEQGTTELVLDKVYPQLNIGDLVMISDDKNIDVIRVLKKVDKVGKTQIAWAEDKPLSRKYDLSTTKIQKFTEVVRPFGYDSPPSILSNVGVTLLYQKKQDTNGNSNNRRSENGHDNSEREQHDAVSGWRAQLVDVSDRVIASADSDKDGKFIFKGLIPGTYRIWIARLSELDAESPLSPITSIPTNHFQLLPGFESWFEAELEFEKKEIDATVVNLLTAASSRLTQEYPFAEKTIRKFLDSISPSNLENRPNDNLPRTRPDTRSIIILKPKESYPFDPVNEDILNSKVYLDKVYGNIKQGSFMILSKDDPSNQIDISRQLFSVSKTGQVFYAKYGIGGNSSTIDLRPIDRKDKELVFCWEEVPGKGTQDLIKFLNEDTHSLDASADLPIKSKDTIEISDQNRKNVYRIELRGNDKATLFKNNNKLLEFDVSKEGEPDNEKTNLYASKIESGFYKIRNTLMFTNPSMELGIDLRYASQTKTDDNADDIVLEGMHIGLKTGMFLGITDNTSIIQGILVDSNLKPLEGYRMAVYRIQKKNEGSSPSSSSDSVSMAGAPIEVASEYTNATGSFTFDDLRADSYVVSLSLPLKRYWSIFIDHIFGEGVGGGAGRNNNNNNNNSSDRDENEKREVINTLLFPEDKKIGSSDASKGSSSPKDKENNNHDHNDDVSPTEVAKQHLDSFLQLIAIIRRKEDQSNLESRFAAYMADILSNISEIEKSVNKILLLLSADSIQTSAEASFSSSSSSSSEPLLDRSLGDSINIIEQELEPKLKELKSKAQQLLDRLPNERLSASILSVREFTEKTIMRTISILEEIVIIVKESLQSPFRSTIYGKKERLLGVTKTLDLEFDTATNITMTFNIRDKLTYVESMLQYSKFQVTKIAGAPTFSEGKTHISLDKALKYRYVKGFAEIYGNITIASHGETVKDEILGSGDASAIHQEFTLRKGPLSHVISPLSPNGIKSTLKVIVNDVQWQETDDFLDSSANDQHYVTSLNEDGRIKVTFGDGIRGSTLPTGIDNVHAQYRVGMGFKGNLPPNALIVPQENNPAIKSISIPAGSYGGAEKILSQQKRSYRPHILTLGRAVSLEDYSNLATTFGEISKARAYLIMKDGQETVVLVVAGQKGRTVSSAMQMELQQYMDERRDIIIPLEIESFVPVPVDIVVEVKVNDSYRRSKVVSDVQTRLGPGIRYDIKNNNNHDSSDDENNDDQGGNNNSSASDGNQGFGHYYTNLFSFERLNFGQKVTLNEVYAVVENVPGVEFAVVRKFCRRDGDGGGRDITAVQEVINANYNEILQCENDPLNAIRGTIKVIAKGGVEL